jgi:hypothetical protein
MAAGLLRLCLSLCAQCLCGSINAPLLQQSRVCFGAVTRPRLPCQNGYETDGHRHSINVIAMTALQKTLVGAALVAAIGTGMYEAINAARLG